MTRLLGLVALLTSVVGCTVSAVDAADDPRPSNSCGGDDDCNSGICRAGVCQDLNGDIEALLLEVTPPADSSLPHLSLVTHVKDVPTGGGDMTFTIPRPAHVKGSLIVHQTKSDCYPDLPQDEPKASDGTLPLSVTLSPRERLLGLPQQLYLATTTGSVTDFSYQFELQVPAGMYDVYVVPPRGQTGCVVPPQLYRNQPISDDDVLFNPEVVVSQAVTLDHVCDPVFHDDPALDHTLCLHIPWPKTSPPLDGWVADIIEPLGGNSISTEFVLADPIGQADTSSTVEYLVPLIYSTVAPLIDGDVEMASDLVRLRPGPDVVAPTVLRDRAGLGLFDSHSAELDSFTHVPLPVRVEGQVARQDNGDPSPGYVTLVSTEISGVPFASFQTTVQVSEDGLFRVDMPPGKYHVHAVPPMAEGLGPVAGALSALVTDWDVPLDPPFQAGKLLELPSITSIIGQSSFPGAQVQVQPSPQSVLPFEELFGDVAFIPRATSGLVDDSGRFEVQVDPGTFDISLRAPDELGFAWFVRAGVEVGAEQQDLGRVQPPQPSVVTGTAFVEGGPDMASAIPSALVRAYAYLDEHQAYTRDLTRAASVIQVAETRTDKNGAFRLLLPSSIAAPK